MRVHLGTTAILRIAGGARPSSAAASNVFTPVWKVSDAAGIANIAAAEDGRAPGWYVVSTWVTVSPKDMGYTGWMPWKETNAMEQRVEIIGKYLAREESVSGLAREYGLSRKTVYKWIERFEHRGAGGLEELSRAPHDFGVESKEATVGSAQDPCQAFGGGRVSLRKHGKQCAQAARAKPPKASATESYSQPGTLGPL